MPINYLVGKLVDCARCGRDHKGIMLRPLERPIAMEDGTLVFTHWAPCPANGDPIVQRIIEPDREYDDCLHCGRVPFDHVCTWKDGF
jgi:hypothetical protein